MNKRKAIRNFSYAIIFLATPIALFIWWAVGTNLPPHAVLPIENVTQGQPVLAPEQLTISSYNMGHGQGIKDNPWDHRDRGVTERQLTLVAEALKRTDADIVLLQEVDLDSQRTFHINQIEFIKSRTNYSYHACALVWSKNYVPFPYWPVEHHIGYVRAANCVLSKFPLSNHERIVFDKPEENPFWYNWGYLDYAMERVNVDVGTKTLAVINVHLDAFNKTSREKQIRLVDNYIRKIDLPVILGGDFNVIPPHAKKQNDFSDADDDYRSEQTLQWFFTHAKNLKVPATPFDDEPFKFCTFPSEKPDRQLDHIFLIGPSLSFVEFRVDTLAKTASDHLPIVAKINY